MNIIVLTGGISTEREISIISGTQVCKALRRKGHKAVLLDVCFGAEQALADHFFAEVYDVDAAARDIRKFDRQAQEAANHSGNFLGPQVLLLCQAADAVFMALHGENGENGKVQAAFDLFGIQYTGSGQLGSALAMDKGLTKQLLFAHQIPTPAGVVLRKGMEQRPPEEYGLTLPCVVKPCCGGSSVGVSIPQTITEYQKALDEAFAYETEIVIEKYIQGREFSVAVVAGEAYPIIEIAPLQGFYDYKNKYQPGKTVETCPADLSVAQTARMQNYALQVFQVLKLEKYARIDFMMDRQGDIYCLEANTLPGMTPTSLLPQEAAAKGLTFAELCELLIKVSI